MSQKNDNFIDKTFTVLADILLKVLPATQEEKTAFSYYRSGMSAQSSGSYAEALENYYEAFTFCEVWKMFHGFLLLFVGLCIIFYFF